MKKYMHKSNKNGFTIIEFVLAMAFIGVILVAVCLITIQITNIYQKGLSLRAVNAVGREIMDDITKTVAGSAIVPNINPVPVAGDVTKDAIETARAKYFVTNNIGDLRQASGVFCTGSFDYIWNTADVLNGVAGEAITITTDESRTFTPKLARIPDTTRQHCTTTGAGVPDITGVSEDSIVELINDDEADLALYDFTVYQMCQNLISQRRKNGSNNTAYLFGHTPTSYNSSNVNYYVHFTSPESTYTCKYAGGKDTKPNFYQIPAESGASCKSATDVAKYSDVGSTFEQQLAYRKISTKKYSERKSETYSVTRCSGTYPNRSCWSETRTRYWYEYGTEKASSSNQTLIGTIKVPYNYALAPYMKHSNSDGITYAGASFNTQAFIATIPRVNKQVQDTAYATRTKDTKIIVASFTMTGSALPISDGKSSTFGNLSSNTVCSVASGNKYGNCKVEYESTNVLNQTNDMLKGSSDESKTVENGGSNVNSTISAAVPYVVPGTKFCVAVGVSPADSHGTGNNSQIDNESQSTALSNSGGGYRVGPPACVTVAKKPTFSVESSQLVTNGNVKTSITNANSRVYGSWSEYGIVSAGNVTNMGSGAAYGYTSPYYNISATGFGVNKGTTGAGLPKSAKSACAYSPQTFGNASCSLGSASIIKSSVDSMAVAKKMYEIYHMSSSDMNDNYKLKYGIRDIAKATRYFGQANNRVTINGKSYVNFYAGSESACQYDAELGRYVAPTPTSTAYAFDENGNKVSTVYCTADAHVAKSN